MDAHPWIPFDWDEPTVTGAKQILSISWAPWAEGLSGAEKFPALRALPTEFQVSRSPGRARIHTSQRFAPKSGAPQNVFVWGALKHFIFSKCIMVRHVSLLMVGKAGHEPCAVVGFTQF